MLAPLDPATLPLDIAALRALLLQRETGHAAELRAAHAGLQLSAPSSYAQFAAPVW